MITINKKDLNKIVGNIANSMFEEYKPKLDKKIQEWRSMDSRPAIVNEPPIEREPSIIDPKSDIQVSDENMPIDDDEWIPGSPTELGRAMKQMSDHVPEEQIEWFYSKLRHLIDGAIDNEDEARMKPRLSDEV